MTEDIENGDNSLVSEPLFSASTSSVPNSVSGESLEPWCRGGL